MGTYRFVARLIAPITTRSIRRSETWRAMAGFDPMPYWAAVEERSRDCGIDLGLPLRASLDYRHPIDLDENVELAEHVREGRYDVAFVVADTVKAVAHVEQR